MHLSTLDWFVSLQLMQHWSLSQCKKGTCRLCACTSIHQFPKAQSCARRLRTPPVLKDHDTNRFNKSKQIWINNGEKQNTNLKTSPASRMIPNMNHHSSVPEKPHGFAISFPKHLNGIMCASAWRPGDNKTPHQPVTSRPPPVAPSSRPPSVKSCPGRLFIMPGGGPPIGDNVGL